MSASRFASVVLTLLLVAEAASGGAVAPSDWPRFRGPNGQGVAPDDARPPSQFGTDKNLAWATELPPGHSSPVVAEGRIFLTACHEKKLETICLDAATGNILWRRPAPPIRSKTSTPPTAPPPRRP